MVDGQSRGWSRREILAGVGALGAGAVAGCADDPGSTTPSGTETGGSGSTAAPATESMDRDSETEIERGTTAGETTIGETTDDGYDRTTVTAYDTNGTELATVEVRVADTAGKRYTGLSDTDSLPSGEGMWFVHPEEGRQAYVMRGMSFPLDIVFVDANGTVTRIFHADVEGTDAPYEARAKYVLEVNQGWTNRTGLEVGDRVVPA